MSGEVVYPESCFHPRRPGAERIPVWSGPGFFAPIPNNVRYYDGARSLSTRPSHSQSEDSPMSAPYFGLPAATSVEQSIIFAQLELLRQLDPTRVEAAKAALLRK